MSPGYVLARELWGQDHTPSEADRATPGERSQYTDRNLQQEMVRINTNSAGALRLLNKGRDIERAVYGLRESPAAWTAAVNASAEYPDRIQDQVDWGNSPETPGPMLTSLFGPGPLMTCPSMMGITPARVTENTRTKAHQGVAYQTGYVERGLRVLSKHPPSSENTLNTQSPITPGVPNATSIVRQDEEDSAGIFLMNTQQMSPDPNHHQRPSCRE